MSVPTFNGRYSCGKHLHNTPEGADRCKVKQVDRRYRKGQITPVPIEPVEHRPARMVRKGPFEVAVYRENRADPVRGTS